MRALPLRMSTVYLISLDCGLRGELVGAHEDVLELQVAVHDLEASSR